MKVLIFISFLTTVIQSAIGQVKETPNTIDEAITILQSDYPDSLRQLITTTKTEELVKLNYPWTKYKTIYEWVKYDNEDSQLKIYLKSKGVEDRDHQLTIILLAFKASLLGQTFDENEILRPYQIIEDKWRDEDRVRFTTDSLRGVYIPVNLDDCFRQIHTFINDSIKSIIKSQKEKEFTSNIHFTVGLWIRNNWGLWGGSRLSKYFNELGIDHPDDMSGIILTSFHRTLKGKKIKLDKQIKFYKDYWDKVITKNNDN